MAVSLSTIGVGVSSEVASAGPFKEHGIDTYVTYNCQSASVFTRWAFVQFSQFKALGANSVGITFPIYTDSISSNKVYSRSVCNNRNYQSPPLSILKDVIVVAKGLGLTVLERPAINPTNLEKKNPNWWQGTLAPTNVHTWFTNYEKLMQGYLTQAKSLGVNSFAIASELDSLSHKPEWPSAITKFRTWYKGRLIFNYSWNSQTGKAQWLGTESAIDAYPAVTGAPDSTPPSTLLSDWNGLLANNPKYQLKNPSQLTIDEIGIPAQSKAFATPWAPSLPLNTHPMNQQVQAHWFAAACQFAKTHNMNGLFFWGPWLGNRGGALLTSVSSKYPDDLQPATQTAIKNCFA
jgi:hypothetical protein